MKETTPAGNPIAPPAAILATSLDSASAGDLADALVIRRSSLPPYLNERESAAIRAHYWRAATELMNVSKRLEAAARRLAKNPPQP